MSYAYTPAIWLPAAVLLVLLALGASSWRLRLAAARPFAVACLVSALWLLSAILMTTAVDLGLQRFWHRFGVVMQWPLITATMVFAIEYATSGRWLTRRRALLLSLPSLAMLALVATNPWHGLAYRPGTTYPVTLEMQGPAVRVGLLLGMLMVVVNVGVFVRVFVRSPRLRPAVAVMIVGQLLARGYYGVRLLTQGPALDMTELALMFVISSGSYGAALWAFGLFDPVVTARQDAFEQFGEGLIVCDLDGRVLHCNPAAQASLGALLEQGAPLPALLRATAASEGPLALVSTLTLGSGPQTRQLTPRLRPLRDHNDEPIGQLVALHDVTVEQRARARLLAEQWASAALQEREMLAHELHDSLSQTLAFIQMQSSAAQSQLQAGDERTAASSLERLANVASEAQGEIRALIGDLLSVNAPGSNLCDALQRAVEHWERSAGMSAQLHLPSESACINGAVSPAAGVQLLRIAQEALANVRKHAGQEAQVAVTLALDDGHVRLAVVDSGVGFDAARATRAQHYGLQVMRQRAERIGGQLTVRSAPGEGASIEVCAPVAPEEAS